MPDRCHLWLALGLTVVCTGCRQDMHDQPKYKEQQASRFFADGRSQRPTVPGTVARGHLRSADREYMTGRTGLMPSATPAAAPLKPAAAPKPPGPGNLQVDPGARVMFDPDLVTDFPLPVTRELLLRGRERFNIFCSPCHGYTGSGNGMIVRRGFTAPPSYHIARLKDAPVGHFFDVITNGYGAMYSYASRVSINDRWAIAAYIRVLQLSQGATPAEVPAEVQSALSQRKEVVEQGYAPGAGNKSLGGRPTLGGGFARERSETHSTEGEHK
ncbi:MAG TPA: cytochrome c [Bryobacteraceae bacterium]|nr:cytochrome c [Bryobacteraceae bacterium]